MDGLLLRINSGNDRVIGFLSFHTKEFHVITNDLMSKNFDDDETGVEIKLDFIREKHNVLGETELETIRSFYGKEVKSSQDILRQFRRYTETGDYDEQDDNLPISSES